MRGPRDSEDLKKEFARRLRAALAEHNLNQSELAEAAKKHLPPPRKGQKRGRALGRDSISNYVNARSLPEPAYLRAIAKALDVTEEDLLPAKAFPVAPVSAVPFELRLVGDGTAYLKVSRVVSEETAMKVMQLIKADDKSR